MSINLAEKHFSNLSAVNVNRVFTEKELAAELGLSAWTIRRLRVQQGLPHFRTEGRIFYRLQTVQAWFAEQEAQSTKHEANYGKIRKIQR